MTDHSDSDTLHMLKMLLYLGVLIEMAMARLPSIR